MSTQARRSPAASATRTGLDAVIEAYKRGVDRTLLRENLKLTVEERFEKLRQLQKFAAELRRAGRHVSPDRLVLGVKRLIEVKRAVGRPRDLEVVAELQALLEETEDGSAV